MGNTGFLSKPAGAIVVHADCQSWMRDGGTESGAALTDRQLHLFANDWRCMYWNNHALPPDRGGPLSVCITRVA